MKVQFWLCDLSEAFDSGGNEINKCTQLNIDNLWLKSYMYNRTHSVLPNDTLSDKLDIAYGVPQCSVLGPILLYIYVNVPAEKINACSLIWYADDSQFFHANTINNLEDFISKTEKTLHNVNNISSEMDLASLKLNVYLLVCNMLTYY